jgi:hypothetical protein
LPFQNVGAALDNCPEVGFEDIAIDFFQARFWTAMLIPGAQ